MDSTSFAERRGADQQLANPATAQHRLRDLLRLGPVAARLDQCLQLLPLHLG
jgi:hypothetical protein